MPAGRQAGEPEEPGKQEDAEAQEKEIAAAQQGHEGAAAQQGQERAGAARYLGQRLGDWMATGELTLHSFPAN